MSVTLDGPFWFTAWGKSPTVTLLDYRIRPGDSWAKFDHSANDGYGGFFLSFWFWWENTTGAEASADVSTSVRLKADLESKSVGGFLPSWLSFKSGVTSQLDATLEIRQQEGRKWTSPPGPLRPSQKMPSISVHADGGWWLNPFNDGDDEPLSVNESYNLQYSGLTMKANAVTVFEVFIEAQVWIEDGAPGGFGRVDAGERDNVVGVPSIKLTALPLTHV
ncbi:hypothetical protein [Streptomyces sp. NPDC002758]